MGDRPVVILLAVGRAEGQIVARPFAGLAGQIRSRRRPSPALSSGRGRTAGAISVPSLYSEHHLSPSSKTPTGAVTVGTLSRAPTSPHDQARADQVLAVALGLWSTGRCQRCPCQAHAVGILGVAAYRPPTPQAGCCRFRRSRGAGHREACRPGLDDPRHCQRCPRPADGAWVLAAVLGSLPTGSWHRLPDTAFWMPL